jgi:short-subunit dehydrogenase
MELNYIGTVNTIKCVVPGMAAMREGHILVVSSGLALTAYMGYSA